MRQGIYPTNCSFIITCCTLIILTLTVSCSSGLISAPQIKDIEKTISKKTSNTLIQEFKRLPLSFEENHGQVKHKAAFIAKGQDYQLLLSPLEAVFQLKAAHQHQSQVKMMFEGANQDAKIQGYLPYSGKINYFKGRANRQWITGINTWQEVHVNSLYPGVDLVYKGHKNSWNTTSISRLVRKSTKLSYNLMVLQNCPLVKREISY